MKVNRDTLRQIGKFQVCMIVLFALGITPGNWSNIGVLFLAPKLDHWCDSEEFANVSMDEQWKISQNWPRCMRPQKPTEDEWTSCETIVHREDVTMEWTVTEKFRLFCDRQWFIQLGNTVYMIGYFLGAIGSGSFADRFGRKKVLLVGSFMGAIANIIAAQAPILEVYYLGRFLTALSDITVYTSSYILCLEVVRKDQRMLIQCIGGPSWILTSVMSAGLVTLLPNYEYVCYVIASLFAMMMLIQWYFYPESPRWLDSRKRHEEAASVITRIAKFNGQEPEELSHLAHADQEEERSTVSPLDLFRTPILRKRTLVLWLVWFNTILYNYGLMFNFQDFGTDLRHSLIISALMDLPGWLLVFYAVEKVGRQISLFTVTLLGAVMSFGMALFIDGSPLLLAFAILGKTFATNQLFLVYQHTPELYPTVIRTMGLGAASTFSRIGGMAAPLISLLNVYWSPTLVVILGTSGLISSALIPFLPDTKGFELAQTIDEGENFLRQHRYKLVLPPKFRCCTRKDQKDEVELGEVCRNTEASNGSAKESGVNRSMTEVPSCDE